MGRAPEDNAQSWAELGLNVKRLSQIKQPDNIQRWEGRGGGRESPAKMCRVAALHAPKDARKTFTM